MAQNTFDEFAIVELFGHMVIAGRVSEQTISGQGFVRVDVPAVDDDPGFTKFYGPNAIYAITPSDERTVIEAVARLRVQPINHYIFQLPAPVHSQEGDDNDPHF